MVENLLLSKAVVTHNKGLPLEVASIDLYSRLVYVTKDRNLVSKANKTPGL